MGNANSSKKRASATGAKKKPTASSKKAAKKRASSKKTKSPTSVAPKATEKAVAKSSGAKSAKKKAPPAASSKHSATKPAPELTAKRPTVKKVSKKSVSATDGTIPPDRKTNGSAAPARASLDDSAIQKRMEELAATLRYHQHKYYIENKPEISDRKFDALLAELSELEENYPDYKLADSPTGLVGSDLESGFEKFEHTVPVLSLGNTYSTEEAVAWAEKTAKSGEKVEIQWKVDGATLVLYYTSGQLTRAVTRGSGQIGDVVTNNAKTIRSIPHQLKEKVDLVARGEVYMTFADFAKFNEESDNIYANPRNLSAGSLKHKKSRDTARRPLRWVAFDVHLSSNPDKFQSDTDLLAYVNQLGLPVFEANKTIVFQSGQDLKSAILSFEEKREEVAFPVDGLVLKLDDRFRRLDLGFTAASPRWATALKFEPDLAETTVEEIEVFVGRTGRITPRARLQPVQLAGTTVTYATLHNADFIEKLGVRVGSVVKVSKRGEIIPAVEEVIDPGKGAPFKFPAHCPSCSTPLVREEDMVDWLCPNSKCPEKEINALVFFCQRKQMDMAGLGEKTIRLLYEQGLLKKIEDIYALPGKKDALEALEGLGTKSVQIILDGIEKSKAKPFRTVMASLGMREIGPFITDVLLQNGYNSLEKWLTVANRKDAHTVLDDLEGIGPDTATTIIAQLKDPENLRRLNALQKAGLQMEEKREVSDVPQTMEGQIWCVTGSFANFRPRDLAMDEIRKRGGRTTGSVSSKTTHLLAGEEAGSKLEKAQKLGVEVVNEATFMKLLEA